MLGRELGRTATAKANGRSVVARLRPVAGRRNAAFRGVRPSVRVFAEAAAAEPAPKALRLEEVKEGAEYEGTVTAVEEFGAFVNFGATSNGLVHISKLAAGFTKNAKDVVQTGQKVTVTVLSVDVQKGRVSLALKAEAAAVEAAADDQDGIINEPLEDSNNDVEEDVEVELEDGQIEIRADLPGFEDIPFVMDEDNADELTEAAVAALEADLDNAEIRYELEAPSYLEEVTGKVSRVEDYGIFLEFEWNGKTLTGLLPRDELKVPSSKLTEEAQAALRAEWADTPFDLPQFAELSDDQLEVKKYYQPGDVVPAFVLESALVEGRGISLTHFTDEDVAAEAVEAFEGLEEDDDEELDQLITKAEDSLRDEIFSFSPEALMEDEEDDSSLAVAAAADGDYEGVSSGMLEGASGAYEMGALRSGLIKGKNGYQVTPLGLPSRPVDGLSSSGLGALGTAATDFGGDEIQLVDYWTSEAYDSIPKDVHKRMGLKMAFDERGEVEFTAREDAPEEAADLPMFLFNGDVEGRAKEFVEDLLDDDEDEAELPARAYRQPLVFAAAIQS